MPGLAVKSSRSRFSIFTRTNQNTDLVRGRYLVPFNSHLLVTGNLPETGLPPRRL
jgi:hypothetical protein